MINRSDPTAPTSAPYTLDSPGWEQSRMPYHRLADRALLDGLPASRLFLNLPTSVAEAIRQDGATEREQQLREP